MTVQTDVLKAGSAGQAQTRKSESLWVDAFRRLLRNKAAMLGGVIILILLPGCDLRRCDRALRLLRAGAASTTTRCRRGWWWSSPS